MIKLHNLFVIAENKTCASDNFQCDLNRCIPKNWICDGEEDCIDKTDEKPTICEHNTCSSIQFTCSKTRKCIPNSWLCDGEVDCGYNDTSDEHENCSKIFSFRKQFKYLFI